MSTLVTKCFEDRVAERSLPATLALMSLFAAWGAAFWWTSRLA